MSAPCTTRPTWVELSRSALRSNYRTLRDRAARHDAGLIGVIKADAYGHGAAEAHATLAAEGCGWFAVTCFDEARALAGRLGSARLLLLSGLYAGEAEPCVEHGFTPVLSSSEPLTALASFVAASREPFRVHLEIDTGMARQGIRWDDQPALAAFVAALRGTPQLLLEGVMTHFASPEDEASSQTDQQIERFRTALGTLRAAGCAPPLLHVGNSATALSEPQGSALRQIARAHKAEWLVRPGIALYGYGVENAADKLSPVLAWKTQISSIRTLAPGETVSYNATFRTTRQTRIALLPVGYADGYNRLLSNKGEVLIRGHRAPIAGRVTMDQIMIDVTDIPDVAPGDEAVLLGSQHDAVLDADDMAARTHTIAYEVLCAIGSRVPRRWIDAP